MDADVIIVGAGPTGLMLAGELRLGGVGVIVLERLAAPTGQSRGLGFTARAMEVFDQRGLLPRFGGLEASPMGHFGGIQFDYTVLPGGHFGARGIPQSVTEQVLTDWALALGTDLRRSCDVLEITDTGAAVEVTASTVDGVRKLTASYVVGCDGGQSTVRKLGGFDFPGTSATREMYLADVVGCGLKPRFLGEALPNGMVMAAPLAPGTDRIIVCPHGMPARERTEPISYEEVAGAWQHITGEDISGGRADWVSSFTDATRQASEYRRGRVLLAGDAAHIHLPAGGQGLSVGVQDAANLGWKLAATVRGWAPDGLLDTYHAERHTAGERLLWNTRAQGKVFLGGPEAGPLRALLTELTEYAAVRRHLAGIVTGLDIRYDFGADDQLVGMRLGDRALRDGRSTTPLLHQGHGVLLDLSGDLAGNSAGNSAGSTTVTEVGAAWADRVRTAAAAPEPWGDSGPDPLAGKAAVLVRPDGYVAWAAAAGEFDAASLEAALRRWFGAPLPASAAPGPRAPSHLAPVRTG